MSEQTAEQTAKQICPIPTCGRPTGWPAPGLCMECFDRVCQLREQLEREETDECD